MGNVAAVAVSQVVRGAFLGVAGHALAVGVGFLAGRIARPSPGGGFEDLAAVVVSFLVTEVVVALACLVGGAVLIGRGRRDLGAGLILGWAVGALATWALIRLRSG
jgi:hypothetical protein